MKRILGFLRPYLRRMGLGFAIKFIGTIGELWLPWILTHLINNIVPLQRLSLIFLWGGLMILIWGFERSLLFWAITCAVSILTGLLIRPCDGLVKFLYGRAYRN